MNTDVVGNGSFSGVNVGSSAPPLDLRSLSVFPGRGGWTLCSKSNHYDGLKMPSRYLDHANTYQSVFCYHRHPGMFLNEWSALLLSWFSLQFYLVSWFYCKTFQSVQRSRFVFENVCHLTAGNRNSNWYDICDLPVGQALGSVLSQGVNPHVCTLSTQCFFYRHS